MRKIDILLFISVICSCLTACQSTAQPEKGKDYLEIAKSYEEIANQLVPEGAQFESLDQDTYLKYKEAIKKACYYYEKWVEESSDKNRDEEESWKVRYKIAQCYIKLKDWESAIPFLVFIERHGPAEYMGVVDRALFRVYVETKRFGKAIKQISKLRRFRKDTEAWWYARYGMCLILYKAGHLQEAKRNVEQLKLSSNGEFDGNKFGYKDKFIELENDINEALPSDNSLHNPE